MKNFLKLLSADAAVERAEDFFAAENGQTVVAGLAGSQKAAVIAAAYEKSPRPVAIITGTAEAAAELENDLRLFLSDSAIDILTLPALDIASFSAAAKSVERAARRMDVLGHLTRGENLIILASAEAAVQKGMSKQEFERASISVSLGQTLEREEILKNLVQLGYSPCDQVETIGNFSSRGGIIDVYPINSQNPVRIEFFDNEIDSLRLFEKDSQRSIKNIAQIDILPLLPSESGDKPALFLSYLQNNATVIFDEPARIREELRKIVKENPDIKKKLFTWPDLVHTAESYNIMYFSLLLQKLPSASPTDILSVSAKAVAPYHKQMDLLIDDIRLWFDHGFRTAAFMTTQEKAESLKELLLEKGISAMLDKGGEINSGTVEIFVGTILNGFELMNAKLAVIGEKEILGRQKKKSLPRVKKAEKIAYFRDINVGDYVVHVNHGIGKYLGVETLEVGGIHRDYLHIKYGGDDKLFLPTDQVNLLQKYIGSEGEVPRLHKMGGTEWAKAKAKVRASVADIAQELIRLYAERRVAEGYAFEKDTTWQREFEDAFPYEETPDQLAAIEDIKRDMESERPMDRLLCGDVGFGKTEVAIRAAFKAVMSGKQVAVLVPTTVLAQQHYQTFKQRFEDFGPKVDVVCRFRTPKEQRETFSRVESGQVDVLIGTHSILNTNNVIFKDLGLLIIDEEQRFGVSQKEKIKKFSKNIDVLTLSATPIPRTLHMSLAGARDMSIIETPPEERYPVQTYVVENNDMIICDAIRRELKRGGQVYFVYNRVETIDKMSQHLRELLPEAKIQTGHGQMPEEMLEQVMLDFYEGRDDILVATSIIENGLDVSNANTIIVYDADKFGLSQLYQMRGRVGRSSHMAFAYFVYQADKVLTEVAEKRLQALKDFAELGSGFKIAMRDLEIRGAGNLLGSQQHGHIASVGFEMYCNLLDEAVQKLKADGSTEKTYEKPPEPVIEMAIEAYLPGEYISDAMHKIEVYQRIAAIRNEKHLDEITDELIDRFGEMPKEVMNLLKIAAIKNMARTLSIQSIIERPQRIEIIFGQNPTVGLDEIMNLKNKFGGLVQIAPDKLVLKLMRGQKTRPIDMLGRALKILLEK
jgi:transcription-repair coupling factor (superfamily II helicase)